MADMLSSGLSGLLAYRRALDVIGHNIANADTPGYSRQRVELGARPPQLLGGGYVGNGVQIVGIERMYDEYLTSEVWASTSAHSRYQTYYTLGSRIDNLLADPDAGLAPTLEDFFAAVHGLANDPTSHAARQVVLSQAQSLVDRFHHLDQRLTDMAEGMNDQLLLAINDINSIARSIAGLNEDIVKAMGAAGGAPPNDLLDKRDALIGKLAQYVDVRTARQDDGSVNVFIGKGQALVLGKQAATLSLDTGADSAGQPEIYYSYASGVSTPITKSMSGGAVGGIMEFRAQVLEPARKYLGELAITLATEFNAQHAKGMDLNGNLGGEFFKVPADPMGGAAAIELLIHDTREIAAAAPIRSLADFANSGNATISAGEVLDASDPNLFDTVVIEFIDANTYSINGVGSYAYTSGDNIDINGWRVKISGTPQAGDKFTVESNAGGVNDNRNALLLAGLQTAKTMVGGTTDFQGAYGQMVADVGIKTRQADINRMAQEQRLQQAEADRSELSGVNLDEEAANLLRFQQAYQAAAQVVAVSHQLFQTLLQSFWR